MTILSPNCPLKLLRNNTKTSYMPKKSYLCTMNINEK